MILVPTIFIVLPEKDAETLPVCALLLQCIVPCLVDKVLLSLAELAPFLLLDMA